MEYTVTFHTHFDALQYSKFLKKLGLKSKLKPVPRELSSSCGTCLSFETEDDQKLDEKFFEKEFEKIFVMEDGKYSLVMEKE